MRDEDTLRETLARAQGAAGSQHASLFRRIVDLLVTLRGTTDASLLAQSMATLERLKHVASQADRREAAMLAADAWPHPLMLWLLRDESPDDVTRLVQRVVLTAGQHRSLAGELSDPIRRLLDARFLSPASSATADPAIDEASSGVHKLLGNLERIRDRAAEAHAAIGQMASLAGDWRWQSDSIGRLMWFDGPVPAGAKDRSLFEFDAPKALWQAFASRTPFRDLPASIAGGDWRLSGVPFFAADGRFEGYRGVAASLDDGGPLGSSSSGDALAKVAHEVRSPLNAIMGFAQMIETQTLGPAPDEHRRQAGHILHNATRLLGALDDLTDAARLDQGLWPVDRDTVDPEAIIERVAARYQLLASARGAGIAVTCPAGLPRLIADQRSLERALNRLVAAVLAVSSAGETLLLGAQRAPGGLRLSITRPEALADFDEEALIEALPAANAEQAVGAPLLGLGFGLRLVRQLVQAMDGRFAIESHHFAMTLPAVPAHQQSVAKDDQNA